MNAETKEVKQIDQEIIVAITQSVIAIVTVLGGGAFLFVNPDGDNTAVVGLMTFVLTWYFRDAQARTQVSAKAAGMMVL